MSWSHTNRALFTTVALYISYSLIMGSARRVFRWDFKRRKINPFFCERLIHSVFCLVWACHCAKPAENCQAKGHKTLRRGSLLVAATTSTSSLFRAFCLVLCLAPGSNGNQRGHCGRSQSSALMTLAQTQADSAHPIRRPPNTASLPRDEPLQSLFGELPFSRSLWFSSQETTKSFSHRHAH